MASSCPIKNSVFDQSVKENGEYKTYYAFTKLGYLPSPVAVSNIFDKDHYIMPGVRTYMNERPDLARYGSMSWFTNFLKEKGYTHVLYKKGKFFYEGHVEGSTPFAVDIISPMDTELDTGDDAADVDAVLNEMSSNNSNAIRFVSKLEGNSNPIYYTGRMEELGLETEVNEFANYMIDKRNDSVMDDTQWSLSGVINGEFDWKKALDDSKTDIDSLLSPGTQTDLLKTLGDNENSNTSIEEEIGLIKSNAISNGTFMKAPNGKPTNLTESQWLQVRTKAFKDWFGDWENDPANASKVVDENGEPKVVYHETSDIFNEFSLDKKTNSFTDLETPIGIFLKNTSDEIFGIENAKQMQLFATIKNPIKFSDRNEAYKYFIKNIPNYENSINYINNLNNDDPFSLISDNSLEIYDNIRKDITEYLKQNGYDGFILEQDKGISKNGIQVIYTTIVFEPNQIKSADNNIGTYSSTDDNIYLQKFDNSNLDSTEKQAIDFADRMSKIMGVKYSIINEDKARDLIGDNYHEESAFFYKGRVYFIAGRLNLSTVFHEFSHPFVHSLRLHNKQLFDKIYDKFVSTEYGKQIEQRVNDAYNYQGKETFKEEVLVYALQQTAISSDDVKSIMYGIKNQMRKDFGKKVEISDLSVDTTLEELAYMLAAGGVISVDTSDLSGNEAEYFKEGILDDLNSAFEQFTPTSANITNIVDGLFKITDSASKKANSGIYAEILPEYIHKGLSTIINDIKKYNSDYVGMSNIDPSILAEQQVKRLAHSLAVFGDIIDKVSIAVSTMKNMGSDKRLAMSNQYDRLLESWHKMLNQIEDACNEEAEINPQAKGLTDRNNPLRVFLSTNKGKIEDSRSQIKKYFKDIVSGTIVETLTPMIETLNAQHKERIDYLEAHNAPEWRLDQEYYEFYGMSKKQWTRFQELKHKDGLSVNEQLELNKYATLSSKGLHLDEDIIKGMLSGDLGDIQLLPSMLTSYLTNNDPIVGGFALYLKNNINDMLTDLQAKSVAYARTIKPLLEAAGYNPMAPEKLRDRIAFKDHVAKYKVDEFGNRSIEKKEVWCYLNPYKDYMYERSEYESRLDELQQKYRHTRSEEDKQAYFDLKWEFDRFKRTYFHDRFTTEYYDRMNVFFKGDNDEIGKKAYLMMQDVFERMDMESGDDFSYLSKAEAANGPMAELWREFFQLSSEYDIDGSPKTGESLLIAQRINEYRQKSKDLFDYEINKNRFEAYYKGYMEESKQAIIDRGIAEGAQEFDQEMENAQKRFIDTYTRPKVKDEFYEYRKMILDRIDEILSQIPKNLEAERAKIDVSELWRKIFSLTSGYRDSHNEIEATDIHKGARRKVCELEEQIHEIRRNGALKKNGLTRSQMERYYYLNENMLMHGSIPMYKPDGTETEELKELNKLHAIVKNTTPLSDADVEELDSLYKTLFDLTYRRYTQYYIDQFNNCLLQLSPERQQEIYETYGVAVGDLLDFEIDEILDDYDYVVMLMSECPAFESFIDTDHYTMEKWDEEGARYTVFRPSYCWVQSLPKDDSYMERYELEIHDDETGEITDVITLPQCPSREFYDKKVKDKYITKVEIGVTKDNRGLWLPKSKEEMDREHPELPESDRYRFINDRYYELERTDKAAFELLETMKNFHLSFQQGLGFSERLYYELPRMAHTSLERAKDNISSIGEGSLLRKWAIRVKEFFFGGAQDYGDTLNYNAAVNLSTANLFADNMTDIPIDGLQDVAMENMSANFVTNELRFLASAEKYKKLLYMSPLTNALQQVLHDQENRIKSEMSVDKNSFLQGLIKKVSKYKDDNQNNRAHIIDILIDREFKGSKNDDFSNSAAIGKLVNFLEGKASFAFFAFNPLSALKNAIGMKYNFVIEGAAGSFVNMRDLAKGNIWAAKTVTEHAAYIHNRGPKPLDVQIAEVFDFNQDKFYNEIGENMSRNVLSDITDGRVFYNFRKFTELQGIYEYGGAALNHIVLDRYDENGNKDVVTYLDAFELDDNQQIKLKSGIDVRYSPTATMVRFDEVESLEDFSKRYHIPMDQAEQVLRTSISHKVHIPEGADPLTELKNSFLFVRDKWDEQLAEAADKYGEGTDGYDKAVERINARFNKIIDTDYTFKIDNQKFKETKNRIQGFENHAGGAYAAFDQPAAQRNFVFRMIFYLRRFAPGMLDNRFGCSNLMGVFERDGDKNRINLGRVHARRNYIKGQGHMGYYSSSIRFLMQNLAHLNERGFTCATPEEKKNIYRMISDILLWLSMGLIIRFVLGFDDDDDDKYKKLRRKSGALPSFFTSERASANFNLPGWLHLQALNLMLQVNTENSQFQLFSGKSFKNYTSLVDISPYFMGPTIESYQRIFSTAFGITDDSDFYSRTVGPFRWQEKGDWKAFNYFLKMFGITGSTIDPLLGIQNQVSFAQKATSR